MTKTLYTICILIFSVHSSSCFAGDIISFGTQTLEENFQKFTSVHAQCRETAAFSKLSEKTIETLKGFPNSTGEALGFLSQEAIRKCSQPLYTKVLRSLLTLESINREQPSNIISEKIQKYKTLMFPSSEIYSELAFSKLTKEQQHTLLGIEELRTPFNAIDAFERTWLKE
ncbi:hypothetical protein [Agarivorans gilvus]|uniref:DUF3015 domain-containing protein n=1 Tax=Agarivorans gilvus TaxID=680279 RepID=A0ABQ1I4V5_9ALTE|nr:hypothetical protein [Agarivorans gilvus]GGB17012.1 hypothetical protein GCM10007414_33080 [Agarivorans gilvus]